MMNEICAATGCERPRSSKGWCKMHAERVRRHGDPEGHAVYERRPLADRLSDKVDRSAGLNACWPFTATLDAQGYGHIRLAGKGSRTIGAHRAAFLLANPGVTPPEAVDHVCHDPKVCAGGPTCLHRRCCNPTHLAASTFVENSSVGRQSTRRLTHCINDHEFTPENTYTYVNARGTLTRRCRACNTESARRRAS